MTQGLIERRGQPGDLARCAGGLDVGAPGAGEIVLDVLLGPIETRRTSPPVGGRIG